MCRYIYIVQNNEILQGFYVIDYYIECKFDNFFVFFYYDKCFFVDYLRFNDILFVSLELCF